MPIRPCHIAALNLLGAALASTPPVLAGEMLPGPVEAQVLRVIDGDTFVARARIWPGQTVTVNVRLRGIDAPEIRTRCAAEKAAGLKSRAALERLIGDATVHMRNVAGGKYYGRVLADVTTPEGAAVADTLLRRTLASAYDGGRRRTACG